MPRFAFTVIRRKPAIQADVGVRQAAIPAEDGVVQAALAVKKGTGKPLVKMMAEIEARSEGCQESGFKPLENMHLIAAETFPMEASDLDRDLGVTYSPAVIFGTFKRDKKQEDTLLLESNEKHYAVVLKQGDNEVILRADEMMQFSEVARRYFNDAYVRMQLDNLTMAPQGAIDFTNKD